MTLVTGGAQRDVRPRKCIPLHFDNDCDHAVFVSSMFTLSDTKADSQPNVVSPYEQVYISQKVCVSGPMFIGFFFLVLMGTTTSQNIRHFFFYTLCIVSSGDL